MNYTKLVSIITINYKNSAVTNQLIASLKQLTWQWIEIIIVDNGSDPKEVELLDLSLANTKLIRSEENLGFAGGNNLGIKEAKGKYILLLNNDTEVEKSFIEPMVKRLENSPSIGAVSPKIRFYFNPDIIQYAGFTKMNRYTLQMHAIGYKQKDIGQLDEARETHFAHGCAMMVKKDVIEKVGLMREEYFLYYEEHDWSMQIKSAGYTIWYEPASLVMHKESISVKKNSTLKTYYLNRNRLLFMRLNFKLKDKILPILYIAFLSAPKNTLGFIFKHKYDHLKAYWKGLMWNLH